MLLKFKIQPILKRDGCLPFGIGEELLLSWLLYHTEWAGLRAMSVAQIPSVRREVLGRCKRSLDTKGLEEVSRKNGDFVVRLSSPAPSDYSSPPS
uniref:Expressed protein n=1 Tax=Echinococcus granulosus TaxID=6210 RepID=A0A068WYB0_ECHGR|nr:expressed protein [Echinococcus granulosus]